MALCWHNITSLCTTKYFILPIAMPPYFFFKKLSPSNQNFNKLMLLTFASTRLVSPSTAIMFTKSTWSISNSYFLMSSLALGKKCPHSELFWSVFSRIRTEYGEILRISPYSVQMRQNTDQNNSEYGHFSRNVEKSYYDC